LNIQDARCNNEDNHKNNSTVLKGSDFGGQMVESHLPSPMHKEHFI